MRTLGFLGLACLLVVGACAPAPHNPGPSIPATAVPYASPAQPPAASEPLVIQPSSDARERLARVADGALVDSGGFHEWAPSRAAPVSSDVSLIHFSTSDGNIHCSGSIGGIFCEVRESGIPKAPRPTGPGNGPVAWQQVIELGPTGLRYGLFNGSVVVFPDGNTLPAGSTIRFGDVECLSGQGDITCVDYSSDTGFQLTRDALTPLRSAEALPRDTRVEPRTSRGTYCGALVTQQILTDALNSLPRTGNIKWNNRFYDLEAYSCRALQAFIAEGEMSAGDPTAPNQVLFFDRGRFVGTATDRPYYGLWGKTDETDPTLIHVRFLLLPSRKQVTIPARYTNGRVQLLEPIPAGAVPAG
ncbi:hypothetical protein FZI91_11130 [Mycobacterium sp. CBMA271]|uniref:LppP/LprE family lipoprotein n=1 Tax=unclassified Mycobacteroides TaxID=2618759 RepID=UPI0012DC56AD|nr:MULTISPECIES: LppP/LprE family lipoprotein [unclassified Mycobacteroides]MUM16244.1 hypothetical protein [Mycobacteroides sp. CBMA 326]MUM22253.1 hypothetical protein [Mycobacteroides sp. CBMA 271]